MADFYVPLILVVEDDPKTLELIRSYLHNESFEVIAASDGSAAIELFAQYSPSLVLLDVMLPKLDGFEVCLSIRKSSTTPIIFLTARDEEFDRVHGLNGGADDYIAKPFSPRELVARVNAVLRRACGLSAITTSATTLSTISESISTKGLVHDINKRRFLLNGQSLSLTPSEFALLKELMSAPGKVFIRNELLDILYPNGELVIDRVIDVHIGKLRQKIGDDPIKPKYIHTVRGIGYRFSDKDETCIYQFD